MSGICGGWTGNSSAKGIENSEIVKKHIDEIAAKLGVEKEKIEFTTHASQVVAGTNHRVGGKVGDKEFSVVIWEKLGPNHPSEMTSCEWC